VVLFLDILVALIVQVFGCLLERVQVLLDVVSLAFECLEPQLKVIEFTFGLLLEELAESLNIRVGNGVVPLLVVDSVLNEVLGILLEANIDAGSATLR